MKEKTVFIAILLVLLHTCSMSLRAQYSDHRNREVDSLEHVLATNPPTGNDLLRLYRELTWGYHEINIAKSMDYARIYIETAISLDAWQGLSTGYGLLALGFDMISQYDSALFYQNKSLEAAERMRDFPEKYDEAQIDDKLSYTYGNIGNIYCIQGMYHEAIEYYQKAMKLFEKHDWKQSQSYVYNNVGEMYLSMDNYEQAEINFIKSDSIAYLSGDSLIIAVAKSHLATVYLLTKAYDKALQNAEIAYGYFITKDEEGGNKAVSLNLLAEIYLAGYGDDARAETYARQALALLEDNDFLIPRQKAITLRVLATIHLHRGQWRQAEQTALEALATDDSEPANALALYEILSKVYAYLGDAPQSAAYIDKHNTLQSSWSNSHYQFAIRDMEVKYETEKKETQIAALEAEKRSMIWISILSGSVLLLGLITALFLWRWTAQKKRLAENQKELAEQAIRQLEQEKQLVATQAVLDGEVQERIRLARDLHDGMGGKLTGMKLQLQELQRVATFDVAQMEQFIKAMDSLDASVHELRRVSHNLMPEALSHSGLKTAVEDFCSSLSSKITFNYYGAETRIDPKLELLVYRCIHELVNNALKYAAASQIMVQIIQEADSIAFTVQDDGCGFDPSAATKGTGLQNIRARVASFGGNIQIDSKAGEGTEVNVELSFEN